MGVAIRAADRPGDLGWMVWQHGEVYAATLGWDTSFEALVARIVADFASAEPDPRLAGWIAELDGERVGCVLCVPGAEPHEAVLRILLVTPDARGHGAGRALVDACVAHAQHAGCTELTLWTNDVLVSARRIYEAAGFELVDSEAHRSFGKDLVGQHWRLALAH
ncbi:MAG TPA: GNAT family N-acetyltransferase [Nocardioides sp.]|uniref:GNAT family N-acetyltransferase n=1 Tax=Nocardioides sp. TaxID=35761 RepID=UPI002E35210A|nr:GNAT family N-acetyltransferase [Nocardioides sp.]HEX5086763.1 GNAT family N-acetyltransferase [Nocardioides sp.]